MYLSTTSYNLDKVDNTRLYLFLARDACSMKVEGHCATNDNSTSSEILIILILVALTSLTRFCAPIWRKR